MSAEGGGEKWRQSARPVRMGTALVVVGFMLLLPTAFGFLSATGSAPPAPRSTPPGLSASWEKTVTFVETGLAPGTSWSVNLSGTLSSSATTTISFSVLPGKYPFTVTPVPGYTADPSAGNVTVTDCSSGVTVDITFTPVPVRPSYTVFFNETGLATGATWWVDFNGTNTSSTASSIAFSAPNDTYIFTDAATVSGAPGVQYFTTVPNGTVTVDGASLIVVIPYSTQYYLTMVAYPAAGGSVTPSSGWYAAGAPVGLAAVNSTGYRFLNWSGSGTGNYTGSNPTPTIAMNSPITENATFGQSYSVDFQEQGLPDGTVWSVTFHGVTESAFLVFLEFSAANGTYNFTVAPIGGYHADVYNGTVTVSGKDVTVLIEWSQVTYDVVFIETGLPTGTSWSVSLNSSLGSSTSASLRFVEPNGTLPFTVSPISGYTANVTSGTIAVKGADITVYLLWTASVASVRTYDVTFDETGLPSGTNWGASLNSTTSHAWLSATTGSVVFSGVANGTYSYWVPDVGTYAPGQSTATFTVSGANVTIDVTFTATSVPITHSTTAQGISIWDLLIIGVIAGGGITVTWLIYRRT